VHGVADRLCTTNANVDIECTFAVTPNRSTVITAMMAKFTGFGSWVEKGTA
jgi:hypothetical protein